MTKFRSVSYSDEQLRKLSFGRVTNDKDVNRNGNHVTTPAGGIYDVRIFGSTNRCDCGKSFPKNSTCPECGTKILGPADLNKRVGHMELKYPYINPLDVPVFIQKLFETIDYPKYDDVPNRVPRNSSLAKLLIFINNYNYRIVEDTEAKDEDEVDFVMEPYNQAVKLIIEPLTEDVKWEDKTAGIIGLQRFLDQCNSLKGRDLKGLRKYIHNVFMVSPANLRMYSIRTGVANPVQLPEISLFYKILIKVNNEAQSLIMNEPEIYDKLAIVMNINKIIAIINNSNQVLASSKQSFVRNNIQSRVDKTGRATISGRMDIPITHVVLPRYLVYHALQTDVMSALKNDPDFTGNPVLEYKLATPLCLKKLDEIVDHSVAMVVRNPTLHKFNLTAFRIILEDKDTIGLSNAVTESFNADFDGD